MDFRVGQEAGASFVYIMPFSASRALIEYTLFSKTLLKQDAYDKGLSDYISRFLPAVDYTVVEEESGSIPMTNYRFSTLRWEYHPYRYGGRPDPCVQRVHVSIYPKTNGSYYKRPATHRTPVYKQGLALKEITVLR